jgi:hypothetical protein
MPPRNLLERPDLAPARDAFARQCGASRAHSALAQQALRDYGSHGPDISGCVREHFPEQVKETLRRLAREASSREAYELRPPRVRMSTMRKLGQAVATRDGSGFYGPQPVR